MIKLIVITGAILAIWVVWSLFVDKGIESPKYTVAEKKSGFEIRTYQSYLVAKVEVEGNLSNSTGKAFRELAGYIFGGNTKNQKLAMTTPVTTEQIGKKIAMTAPVETTQSEEKMTMTFMMPSEYTHEMLPKPNSTQITFEEVPSGNFAVRKFTGWANDRSRIKQTKILSKLLENAGHITIGQAVLLQYDRPFKFPYLRTNEIKIEINYQDSPQ
jgi:DNA gyrase inhibitor GyrI